MRNIFDLDNPVMRFLNKVADLIIINILTFICCIPVFTIGASITAMHYVMLKMVRGEEGYITKDFFKSFKLNFKQATAIWLIMVAVVLVFVGDYYIIFYSGMEIPQALSIIIVVIAVMLFILSTYIFPVLSKFDNSVKNTIKNGIMMSVIAAPRAIGIALLTLAPLLIAAFMPEVMSIVIIFGFTGPAYLSALLYDNTFRKFEPEKEAVAEEEEFHVAFDEEE